MRSVVEWWLPLETLIINSDKNRPNGIHVIEYSHYEKVLAQRDELLSIIQIAEGKLTGLKSILAGIGLDGRDE